MNNIDYNRLFKNKFNPAYRELDKLKSKIDLQEGFWIFKSHCYSKEKLLNSKHFYLIYSTTWKIGSDVRCWLQNGNLPLFAQAIYNSYRDELASKLLFVNRLIQNRQPTWWEEVKDAIWGVINVIMGNLPKLFQRLISFGGKKVNLLPYLKYWRKK